MSVSTIGIVGCGVMGSGIAHVAAKAGLKTVLVKLTPGDTAPARAKIEGAWKKEVEKGKLDAAGMDAAKTQLSCLGDLNALAGCDLVVEAIVEELPAKKELFAKLEKIVSPKAILASNTSSLSITAMAEGLAHPERFVGLHFFGPVPAMALVEIIATEKTSPDVTAAAVAVCKQLGKTPVVVGDSAGFIVNRLLVPYLLSGMAEWSRGLSNPHDIDTAMKLGCAHPMGPFALSDLIGLDIVLAMAESLHADSGEARFQTPPVLRALVAAGHLGRKTKKGFFDYSTDPAKVNDAAVSALKSASRAA